MQNIVLIRCTAVLYVLIVTRKQMPTKRRTATKVVIKTGEQRHTQAYLLFSPSYIDVSL